MFKKDKVWDHGFFKALSSNDTGKKNNQAGPVINIELQQYLPPIIEQPTIERPAVSISITAELCHKNTIIATVPVRYQIQSWPSKLKKDGTFKQEKRLTRNLQPLLTISDPGDIWIVQRQLDSTTHYRFTLLKQSDHLFKKFISITKGRKLGPVSYQAHPESFEVVKACVAAAENFVQPGKFHPMEKDPKITTSTITRYYRDLAFRTKVLAIYGNCCAVCGKGFLSPSGLKEVDAAHIIPRGFAGANDPRNGIALCKSHHWAFDNGLFWVDKNRKIHVPSYVSVLAANKYITEFHTEDLADPNEDNHRPDLRAFEWHEKYICRGHTKKKKSN
jgi:putative restriction endonuclease